MARAKKTPSVTPAETPREKERKQFTIRTGQEIPPIVRESKYPWGKLVEALAKNPKELPSFPMQYDSQDEASKARSMIQGSGRNYYVSRRMNFNVISRVVNDPELGWVVESWIMPAPPVKKD